MAKKTESIVLEILRNNGGEIDITQLGQEMITRRALGFGVEIEDVVYWLENRGRINFDSKTDLVSIKINYQRGLCGKPDLETNKLSRELAERNPPKCSCCGFPMLVGDLNSLGMEQLGMYRLICPNCP